MIRRDLIWLTHSLAVWACFLSVIDIALLGQSANPAELATHASPKDLLTDVFAPEPVFAIHKRVEEVRFLFSVSDGNGRPVTGLLPNDLVVEDNGRPVAKLTSLFLNPDMPLQVAVLVDDSLSMTGNSPFSSKPHMLTGSRFLDTVALGWPNFSAAGTASTSVKRLVASRSTALLDALWDAMEVTLSGSVQPGRRAILLLSDGEDNASLHAEWEVIRRAQRSDITIYAVAAHSAHLRFPGDRTLRDLCEATGGRFFVRPNYDAVDSILKQMRSDLSHTYEASFRPEAGDLTQGIHSLEIRTRHRGGLRLRAQKAYVVDATDDPREGVF